MFRLLLALALLFAAWLAPAADARQQRSMAAILAFKRANPCPSTGARRGACPGYVIDHVVPLCAGGDDAAANMQWQEYRESLVKDAQERRECRALGKVARER